MDADIQPSISAGTVYLVGAGPGDAQLLTVKALRLIQAADAIVHDHLVSPEILACARPNAELYFVGKKGGGFCCPQRDIEGTLIRLAREGKSVVRLKGGDPFIFGRGGEEVESLRAAGIEVAVVNGITSGLAAITSLGVPLTHRAHAHGVVFVTGHAKPGDAGTDWRALAATARDAKLTLVIYMGVSGARRIQDELLTGLSASTPVAIVQRASLPDQRHAVTTLGQLHPTLERENYRGHHLATAAGLLLVAGTIAVEGIRTLGGIVGITDAATAPDRVVILAAVVAFGFLGLVDDLLGDGGDRGLKGHVRAALTGRVTTGFVKLGGGAAVALVLVGALLGDHPDRVLVDGALVAAQSLEQVLGNNLNKST